MKYFYLSTLFLMVLLLNTAKTNAQCAVIYASPTGTSLGDGSEANPMDLQTAVSQACTQSRFHVRLLAGTYNLTSKIVVNCDNLIIDGDWEVVSGIGRKNSSLLTTVNLNSVIETAAFDGASGTTVGFYIGIEAVSRNNFRLEDITFNVKNGGSSGNASGTTASRGNSVYGFYFRNCSGWVLERCIMNTGAGSNGANGINGATGANGSGGANGTNSDGCDGSLTNIPGGNGGGAVGAGVRLGGAGGAGGRGSAWNSSNNAAGLNGTNGGGGAAGATANGAAGANGTSCGSNCNRDGRAGSSGANGTAGVAGTTPAISNTFNFFWLPNGQSPSGTDGQGGGGGKGGGGGGRQSDDGCGFICFCIDGPGSGGGGGGSGGEGGQAGSGGFGGGGSFALYTFGGNGTQNNVTLTAAGPAAGGVGGVGGNGGNGGVSGLGGGGNNNNQINGCSTTGGRVCGNTEVGAGGQGGAGGAGGRGGDGAAGAAGVSALVQNVNSATITTNTTAPITQVISNTPLQGCANSEIIINKDAGTWTLPANAAFIQDLNVSQSTYNNSSATALISYNTTGAQPITINAVDYGGFVMINTPRALPTFAATMPTTVCEGDVFSLSTPTTGAQHEWIIFPVSATTAAPTAIFTTSVASWITPVTGLTESYRVRLRVRDNCCGWSAPVYFNFNVVATSNSPVANGSTICTGQTATLTATGSGIGNLTWYADPLGQIALQTTAGASTTFTTPSLTQSAVYYVAESISGCLSTLTAVQATVAPTPNPPAGSSAPVCDGLPVILNGFGTGGTLSWFNVASGGTALGTGTSFNAGNLTAGSYTFYLSESNGTCNSPRTAVGALVNAAPAAPTASAATICSGNSTTLTATASGTVQWYADAAMITQLASGASFNTPVLTTNTTYHVAQVNAAGCRSTSATPVTVTVTALPSAPSATGATVCAGNTATLTAVGGAGTLTWYADPSGSVALGTGASFTTPVLNQSTAFYVRESSSGCLSPLTQVTATVNALPTAPAGSASGVCAGSSVILNGFGSGGTLNWFNVASGGTSLGSGSTFNAGTLTAGTYTFYVEENNGSCSSSRTPVAVTVNAAPSAPTASGTSICSGATTSISASGTGVIQWYADATLTTLLATGSTFNTPVLTNNTTYQAVAASAAGCLSTATAVTVTINALPSAPSATGATVCAGNTATLTVIGGAGTLTWYADPSGSVSVGTGSSFTTSVLNQSTAFYVRESSASGCLSPLTQVTATVNALPTAPAGSASAVCAGSSVILNGFGSGGTLSWFNVASGGASLGSGSTFNAGTLTAGTYTFYVEENNGNCSSARTPVAVTVNAAPSAPTASGASICSGATASLSATGSGVIQWYADATLTTLLATGSTFNTPVLTNNTTYQAVASSAAGCLSPATAVTVTINALPSAPIGTGATICAGNTANLSAIGGAGSLTWYADPSGSVSVGSGSSFTTSVLNQTTAFYVRESSASGCLSPLTQVTATVNALPTAPAGSAAAVCTGSSVILNGFGSGGTLNWFNVASGGTSIGSGTTFNAGTLTAGTYTFYVEENNGNCSSARTPVAVTVNAAPAAPTALNDGPACEGETIFLQASNISGASYSWTGPNGFSSNQQTIMIFAAAVSNAGVYSVSAIVNGCASTSASTTVSVNSLPVISGAISNNGPLCEGEDLNLTAPTVTGVTYEWTGPNGFTSNQQNATINAVNELDQQGFYTLVITDANSCSSAPLSTLVEISSLPQAGMAISNGPLCSGSTLNLSVAEVFGATYSWSGPNGFVSNDRTPSLTNVSAAEAGLYTVTVSRNNCQTELDVNVIIDTVPNVTVIADTTIESSDELLLYASGGVIYQWSPANFLSSPFSPTTIFARAPEGTYTLTVLIQDAKGCSAEEQVNITVEGSDDIVVTDLFTPNGDGVNETWVIEF